MAHRYISRSELRLAYRYVRIIAPRLLNSRTLEARGNVFSTKGACQNLKVTGLTQEKILVFLDVGTNTGISEALQSIFRKIHRHRFSIETDHSCILQ